MGPVVHFGVSRRSGNAAVRGLFESRGRVVIRADGLSKAGVLGDLEKEYSPLNANEAAIRKAYQVAEGKDVVGWVNCFTKDGTFTDESIGVTYRGPDELGRTVETYATAFPDMHRELYRFYVIGDTVVVELALQGTHKGPLALPQGTVPPTGKRMDAPCCDVFRLIDGKIQSFNCYPSGTVILGQLGILPNLDRPRINETDQEKL
jgi:ketosteroid isomerase-like protein